MRVEEARMLLKKVPGAMPIVVDSGAAFYYDAHVSVERAVVTTAYPQHHLRKYVEGVPLEAGEAVVDVIVLR